MGWAQVRQSLLTWLAMLVSSEQRPRRTSAGRRGRPECRQKLGWAGSLPHARISNSDSPTLPRKNLQFLAFLEIRQLSPKSEAQPALKAGPFPLAINQPR